jgi:hypothetical protein
MMNHVSARCAHYRLLFPSRNIESIVTLGEGVRLLPPLKHGPQPGADDWPTLDLSRLLGARPRQKKGGASWQTEPAGDRPRIQLDWVSSDSLRRAALLVDAVDEIVASHLHHLERVPFLPSRLLPLCDGVLRDADSTCRLSVRFDVAWPMTGFADRRLWREALVRIEPVSAPDGATETANRPVTA